MLNKSLPVLALQIPLLIFSGCTPSLPMVKENSTLALPASFQQEKDDPSAPTVADVMWKDFFHDPKLNALISLALKNNRELKLLEQEIYVANNEVFARQGEYIPKVGLQAGGGVEQTERFSTPDSNTQTMIGRGGLTTSWELDIWGKLRSATKSAYYSYLSSVEARRFMVTGLVAELSSSYFELMALDNELEFVESYIVVLSKIRSMVELQKNAARATSLAVKRFEAEVLKNESRKFNLIQQITITQNKINVLLGRFPQQIDRDSKKFADFTFSKIRTSIPSQLIDHRPDVKKASYELQASKLNVQVAKARFYPSLSIEGGVGYEYFNSQHFQNPSPAPFYSLLGNLTAPLLNRQAIKADYFSANNKQIQAVYNYEQTILKAYSEVANQLTTIKNLNQIYDLKVRQVRALSESIEISNILFRAARVDYLESLFTQRDALEAQVEMIEIKKQQLMASVNLYKALGGGWKGIEEDHSLNTTDYQP